MRFTNEFALAAIKALQLSNAGAVVAVLTFYGNLAAKEPSTAPAILDPAWLRGALFAWAVGMTLAVSTSVLAYLSLRAGSAGWNLKVEGANVMPVDPSVSKRAEWFEGAFANAGVVVALMSLAAFSAGCYCAGRAFLIS